MHMKKSCAILLIVILFDIFPYYSDCIDFVSATAALSAIAVSFGYAGYNMLRCRLIECCDKNYINMDFYGINIEMEKNLFGQHLVKSIIYRSIQAHLQKENPDKALVMSFNGDTGSGKNHVYKMIEKYLYKKGLDSQFTHFYIGSKDFPHSSDVLIYREKLRKEVEEKSKLCERSLFVFDEVDKIPAGVLDAMTPYLDYHGRVDGVDYRKNIIIFLSNAGAENINQVALNFWANGKDRESITMKDVEPLINKGVFNELGGLYHSEIVKRELIDVYVPFLPLEKKHVKKCVNSELTNRHLKGDIDEIANSLEYYPETAEIFSKYGCKKVSKKVDIYVL